MGWLRLFLALFGLPVFGACMDFSMTLPDNRTLSYAIYGDPMGQPVFYFHGGQESRLSAAFLHETALNLRIRLIAPDRPGVGQSDFQPERRFIDWSQDIAWLAQELDVQQFSVMGLSGGAPHVLAVLQAMPDRVHRASIVSGAIPYDVKGSTKGMWFPVKMIHYFASRKNDKTLRKIMQGERDQLFNAPDKKIRQFQKYLPKPDRELMLEQPEVATEFIRGSQEAFSKGIDGVVQEWRLYVQPWDIDLAQIHVPVSLWYGGKDKMAPPQRGLYLEKNLPRATLHEMSDEGHFSLIHRYQYDILSDLLQPDTVSATETEREL